MRIKGMIVARSGIFRADSTGGEADPATSNPGDIVRDENGNIGQMIVRFSPFDTWYEINSMWEGRFLERTMPGAFRKTIKDAKRGDGTFSTKSLFDHGMDMSIGDKPLGVPTRFEEIDTPQYRGPELEVPLLDTTYNRDIVPMLRANALGSSFMFEVMRESWDHEPDESDHNPNGLPERTIQETRTIEAGPVTFPASPTATAGVRCMTDGLLAAMTGRNSARTDDLVRSFQAWRAAHPAIRDFTPTPGSQPRRQVEDQDAIAREQTLRQMRLRLMKARL